MLFDYCLFENLTRFLRNWNACSVNIFSSNFQRGILFKFFKLKYWFFFLHFLENTLSVCGAEKPFPAIKFQSPFPMGNTPLILPNFQLFRKKWSSYYSWLKTPRRHLMTFFVFTYFSCFFGWYHCFLVHFLGKITMFHWGGFTFANTYYPKSFTREKSLFNFLNLELKNLITSY